MLHRLARAPVHKGIIHAALCVKLSYVMLDVLALLESTSSMNWLSIERATLASKADTAEWAILVLLDAQLLMGALILVPRVLLQIRHRPAVRDVAARIDGGHSRSYQIYFTLGFLGCFSSAGSVASIFCMAFGPVVP
jgi:hypothetical protein